MDLSELWKIFLHPFELLFDPSQRLSVIYMASALVAAVLVYWRTRVRNGQSGIAGIGTWLLPWDILKHASAKADYVMFFINKSVVVAIYASMLVQSYYWVQLINRWMGNPSTTEPSAALTALYTIVVILVLDFALWLAHYVFHKVPVLWEFHKVHHSAEVMTPLTAARMHPFEEAITAIGGSFAMGVTIALLDQYFGVGAGILTIFEINVVLALFYFAAFNLRHSHVWLRYPNWLQHIFVSPAQHQIHHSKAMRHWDKNMGFIFAFWDMAAGTLYSPKTKEDIDYGLGNGEDGTWNSATTLYLRPFKNAYNLFASGWRNAFVFPPKHLRPREKRQQK